MFESNRIAVLIDFASHAFEGNAEENRQTIRDEPYNYKNTLTMKSWIRSSNRRIDLPLLVSFTGDNYIFHYVGSAFLESNELRVHRCRYSSLVFWWNSVL